MASPFLSVIIPAFNEEARLIPSLEKVVAYLSRQSYSWEVLVADDGSSDGTATLVNQWALVHQGVRIETIPHRGKGWAVRHGMLAASGEYRFMCDADLAMPIEGLGAFLERMGEGYDIVIGSRQIADARRFNEPATRHILGRLFNWSVRLLAVGGFQDTQCGFKMFRRRAARDVLALQRLEGWAFDVEVLYLARRLGYSIVEVPVEWHESGDSRLGFFSPFWMALDLFKVRRLHRHLRKGTEESGES